MWPLVVRLARLVYYSVFTICMYHVASNRITGTWHSITSQLCRRVCSTTSITSTLCEFVLQRHPLLAEILSTTYSFPIGKNCCSAGSSRFAYYLVRNERLCFLPIYASDAILNSVRAYASRHTLELYHAVLIRVR